MKLTLIDGLPGTGKSTLAEDLAAALTVKRQTSRAIYETDVNHPLHPIPTDAMGAAWADIHERLSPEAFAEKSLNRWTSLCAHSDEDFLIVESFPFQCAIRVLLQIEAPPALIDDYWQQWIEIVRPHAPLLLFLQVDDALAQLRQISTHRGPEWTDYVLDAFGQVPIANGLKGWEAVSRVIGLYQATTDRLLAKADLPTHYLEGRPTDYGQRLTQAIGFLALPAMYPPTQRCHPERSEGPREPPSAEDQ